MAEAATAQADEIFRRLRVDILKGRWEPRSGLPFDELSACYGTSGGVLREVLPRLAGQSPVVSEPQPGFRVVPVSVQDLRHLTEARVAIETLALRQLVTWGAVRRELAPLAAHRTLSRTPPYGEDGLIDPEWLAAHARFPSVLVAPTPGCGLSPTRRVTRWRSAGRATLSRSNTVTSPVGIGSKQRSPGTWTVL